MPSPTPYQKVNIVDADGNLITSFGGGSSGTGGSGDASAANQASQIALETQIRDRLPAFLINGRLAVDVQSLNVSVSNAQLEIANDVGNPIPVNGSVSIINFPSTQSVSGTVTANFGSIAGAATEATLSTINDKFPVLGQALSAACLPVVLPASQVAALAPLSTINLGTIGNAATEITLTSRLSEGTNITGVSLPSGSGAVGWFSFLWKLISDRLPSALVGDRLKVDGSGVTQPVSGSVSVSNLPATQTVSGTVTANFGTIAGAATETTLASRLSEGTSITGVSLPNGSGAAGWFSFLWKLISDRLPSTLVGDRLKVDGSGVTQPVSGSVNVSNFPTIQAISATSLPLLNGLTVSNGKLLVDTGSFGSGGGGDANAANQTTQINLETAIRDRLPSALVSDRLKVDGSGVTQPISGSINISNFPATQPISATSLPLPSGAATAANQTTQINSLASIDGKLPALSGGRIVTQTVLDSTTVTGSANALNGLAIVATDCSNYSYLSLQLTGNLVGVVTFEASNDNTNWVATYLYANGSAALPGINTNNNGIFYCNKVARYFRARVSNYTSGTINATLSLGTCPTTPAFAGVSVNGTPSINLNNLNGAATATNQTTGNTSLSSIDTKLPSALASDRLKVDVIFPGTQAISTTVLPLPTGAATSTLQTDGNTLLTVISSKLNKPTTQTFYGTRGTAGDSTIISAVAGQKIRIYGLKLSLKGTAENVILIKDGSTTIDQYILTTKGDQAGYVCDFPVDILSTSSALILNFSSTSEVIIRIFYDFI